MAYLSLFYMKNFLIICLLVLQTTPAFSLDIQEVVSSRCDIKALLVEEKSLPIISISVSFKHAGNAYDADGKEGLATLTAGMLDKGAGDLSAFEFSKKLEEISASVGFGAGKDFLHANLKTLSKNKKQAMNLFVSAIKNPRFDKSEITTGKQKRLSLISRLSTNPNYVVGKIWREKAFPNHPYNKSAYGTVDTVNSITREDIRAYAGVSITREAYISIAGDISRGDAVGFLNRLCDLPSTGLKKEIKTVSPNIIKEIESFKLPLPQSKVVFGGVGVARDSKDFYAAYILNYIVGGGGMSSRLMKEIRINKGLAYSIGSYLNIYEKSALWMGSFSTKNQDVMEAIEGLKSELSRVATDGVSEQELEDAKKYITGAFYLGLDESDAINGYLFSIQRFGLGLGYLEKRNQYITEVSLQEVNRVAKNLLSPDNLFIAIVGDVPHETIK